MSLKERLVVFWIRWTQWSCMDWSLDGEWRICDGLQGTIDAYFRVFAVVAHQHTSERRTFPCRVMVVVTTRVQGRLNLNSP